MWMESRGNIRSFVRMILQISLVTGILLFCCTYSSTLANLSDVDPFVVQVKGPDIIETNLGSTRVKKAKYTGHNIRIEGNEFMLDGQPLHIVSGSLHYFRVPAAYWRDRLSKLKAAGLNSVATYVEWSYHEPEERQYNFEGDRDIVTFIKTAAEEGLHVLLRPGPYICAERDLGGLPYWLLGKYPKIQLRTTNTDFINETKVWMKKLFDHVEPLLFGNGGPIILVQVENEYGSYGKDMKYKKAIRDIMQEHVGTNALLYTTDGASSSYIEGGAVPGVLTTVDFGPTSKPAQNMFLPLRRFMPNGPLMNSEFYPGWLTHWREELATVSSYDVVKTLKDMMENKINVNFYMFFGGSNFEFTAGASHQPLRFTRKNKLSNFQNSTSLNTRKLGANYDGTYQPDITSYDYDAPLSEAGDPTPKYYDIREALKNYNLVDADIPPPQPAPKGKYGKVTVDAKLDLFSPEGRATLGKKHSDVAGAALPTFESLRQRGGFVLYETVLTTEGKSGLLEIQKPRDLISVYLDGILMGQINRMVKIYSLPLTTSKNNSVLSLLVENQGRINFGHFLHDYKGILSEVIYDNKVLNGTWKVTGYPLENVDVNSSSERIGCPTLFEGQFTLPEGQAPLDTFLDPTGWGKGFIWINGHNLGRYWPTVGPQITLYVPGIWLKPAPEANRLQILELANPALDLTVEFRDYPILNRTNLNYKWY